MRLIYLLLLSVYLIGCGGGGGGGGSSSSSTSASFTVSSTSGEIPFTVSLDASQSNGATSYAWSFGDGTVATGRTTQKTYTTRDDYTIRLTVMNDKGRSDSVSRTVRALGYSISGRLSVPSSTVADSDTADPNMNTPNNSFAQAQLIPSPAILGGYLDTPTDPSDFYRIDLAANQTINLTIQEYVDSAPNNPDLDLYLFDENQIGINSAISLNKTESLTVGVAGTYYIEVRATNLDSTYQLNIGGISINQTSQTLDSDFVAGEAIIKEKSIIAAAMTGEPANIKTLTMPDPNLSAFSTSSSSNSIQTLSGEWSNAQKEKLATLYWMKELERTGNYEYVEPNYYRKAFFTPDDPLYNRQWHYDNIQLEEALDIERGNSNAVIVAVADTGVLVNHPDLQNQIIAGYDFVSNDSNANDDGDKANADGSSSFHGTHVAGTIAATTNNTTGATGVAGGTAIDIMPLRVLGINGIGTSSDIIQSLRFAARLSNDSGTLPPQAANIINLSLGSTSFSQAEQDIINTLAGLDILVIAAAGNRNSSLPDYPAGYNNVISVSATNISNQRASYSNFGTTIDIAAPGGEFTTDLDADGFLDAILSTMGDDSSGSTQFNYGYSTGTSMASPHVAGVAALMKSANAGMTVTDFNAFLINGDLTDDIGSAGRDNTYGYGLLNARKAVQAAAGSPNGASNIILSTSTLNFGSFGDTESLTITDSSDGSLTIASITPSDSWLSITPDSVNANGFGSYSVSIDRGSLADGIYTATAIFDATSVQRTLNIIMQVTTEPLTSDAGYLYILAVNPDNIVETLGFTEASSSNGEYLYSVRDLPLGDYQIVAGTDLNADGKICDKGDSCGWYLTTDQRITLDVSGSQTNIDFAINFDTSIGSSSNSPDATETKLPIRPMPLQEIQNPSLAR